MWERHRPQKKQRWRSYPRPSRPAPARSAFLPATGRSVPAPNAARTGAPGRPPSVLAGQACPDPRACIDHRCRRNALCRHFARVQAKRLRPGGPSDAHTGRRGNTANLGRISPGRTSPGTKNLATKKVVTKSLGATNRLAENPATPGLTLSLMTKNLATKGRQDSTRRVTTLKRDRSARSPLLPVSRSMMASVPRNLRSTRRKRRNSAVDVRRAPWMKSRSIAAPSLR